MLPVFANNRLDAIILYAAFLYGYCRRSFRLSRIVLGKN